MKNLSIGCGNTAIPPVCFQTGELVENPSRTLEPVQARDLRDSAEQPAEGFPRAPEHDEEIVRLFALFHDSCRHDEYADPGHGSRGAQLAIDFRQAGRFHLDDPRMELLVTAKGQSLITH